MAQMTKSELITYIAGLISNSTNQAPRNTQVDVSDPWQELRALYSTSKGGWATFGLDMTVGARAMATSVANWIFDEKNGATGRQWLANKGYEVPGSLADYSDVFTTGEEDAQEDTTGDTSNGASGGTTWADLTPIQVTIGNNTVTRYAYTDKTYGGIYGLADKNDTGSWDVMWTGSKWIPVSEDANGRTISTDSEYEGKYYDPLSATWLNADGSTADTLDELEPWERTGQFSSPEEYEIYLEGQRLQNQLIQQELDNYTNNPTQENYASLQEAWTEYVNNYNINKIQSQNEWSQNKAAYDLQANQWATEQQQNNNEYLASIAREPMEMIPYLYISGGSSTPSWFKSSYKAPVDPWSQIPQYPTMTPYPEMQQWNAPAPTPVVEEPEYVPQSPPYNPNITTDPNSATRQPGETFYQWWSRLNPQATPAYSGANYGNQNWYAGANGTYTATSPSGQSSTSYGVPSTIDDTLAALREANPGVYYYIENGKIKVG